MGYYSDLETLIMWFHGVMVITSDFDSDNLSSILSGTFFNPFDNQCKFYRAKNFILSIIKE
jgi:hypothetical protein